MSRLASSVERTIPCLAKRVLRANTEASEPWSTVVPAQSSMTARMRSGCCVFMLHLARTGDHRVVLSHGRRLNAVPKYLYFVYPFVETTAANSPPQVLNG